MKRTILVLVLLAVLHGTAAADDSGELASLPLFRQAVELNEKRYAFAVEQKAQFYFTPDRRSFIVLWIPGGGKSLAGAKTVFTLHGHASTAFDEFFLWHRSCSERGYAIVALQWWFGRGESVSDYYSPQEINRIADRFLEARQAAPLSVLLHGFSRGAANTYGVAALSRHSNRRTIGLVLSNAGGAAQDFPINREITQGRFGPRPFDGIPWVLYAAAGDPNPDRDGIPAMERTRAWLESNGARVILFIKDSAGDHGGFHRNAANIAKVLDQFDALTATARQSAAR